MSDVSFLLPLVVGAIIIVATIIFAVSICCGKYCPACRQRIVQRRKQDDLVRECTRVCYYKTAAYPASQFTSCAVCLEDFLEKEKVLMCPCHHIFHKSCLVTWLETESSCPICKATVRHTADSNNTERAALLS